MKIKTAGYVFVARCRIFGNKKKQANDVLDKAPLC